MLCLRLTCTVPMELGAEPSACSGSSSCTCFLRFTADQFVDCREQGVGAVALSLTRHPQTISGIQVCRQESRYTSRRVASDAPASAPERLDCRPTPAF